MVEIITQKKIKFSKFLPPLPAPLNLINNSPIASTSAMRTAATEKPQKNP
jgi:hypothetical protein